MPSNSIQAQSLPTEISESRESRALTHLRLHQRSQAIADYTKAHELDAMGMNTLWMVIWIGMGKQRIGQGVANQLESIATINPNYYLAYICRGIVLSLRGQVKEGRQEVERAISLKPNLWDAYFWKGLLAAYYYRGRTHREETEQAIERALEMEMPPVLLTPLYWLEQDVPDVFEQFAKPLLEKYGV